MNSMEHASALAYTGAGRVLGVRGSAARGLSSACRPLAMSGLKIVLKLNRAKVGPSAPSGGCAPPPLGPAPVVSHPEPQDSGAHSKKEKKEKMDKKKRKRHHHEHAGGPGSGAEAGAPGAAAPGGERPSKKRKEQAPSPAGGYRSTDPLLLFVAFWHGSELQRSCTVLWSLCLAKGACSNALACLLTSTDRP